MPDLLLEIGTEEIPAVYMSDTLEQVEHVFKTKLEDARIEFEDVRMFGTPRRIVIRVLGVAEQQQDLKRAVRGPAVKTAYDAEGKPTKALEGFLRGQSITIDQLMRIDTPQGEYVVAYKIDEGRVTIEVLADLIPELIKNLAFPKFMRWGEARIKFVRPIRWILALLGSDVIPFDIDGIKSSNKSRGHRFLAPEEFTVTDADDYFQGIREAWVMVNPSERETVIREGVEEIAESVGIPVIDADLLDENVFLVEYPTPLLGKFDESLLELPEAVLITAMKKHEKFFPIRDKNGKLTPYFVSIRNGNKENLDTVREGNERVLTARFNDAKFFFDEDLKHNLDYFAGRLDRLVFQEKLGTIKAKIQRLEHIVAKLGEAVGWDSETRAMALQATHISKADLVSGMVVELPSLQGVIGGEYARREGVSEYVAEAIEQHYLPKGAGDHIPDNLLARAISLSDRIDTLVGYIGLGYMPTGSSDPFALRRAAQGIVEILAEEDDFPTISELRSWAYEAFQKQEITLEPEEKVTENLNALFQIRLSSLLEQESVRYDLARAAMNAGWTDSVSRLVARALLLQEFSTTEYWQTVVTAAVRPANIINAARKNKIDFSEKLSDVDENLFEAPEENTLFQAVTAISPEITGYERIGQYDNIFETLATLAEPINQVFDAVMVMAEDPAKRKNRLTLMAGINHLFLSFADFTQVVTEGEG
ncbi:MAG: glycine--tRNA ligase subunit beta [bacterium]